MRNIKINGDRLWESLMEMAKIGATEKGGNCRLALTDLDKEGRDLFVRWCQEAGCEIRVDKMGNIFARRPGKDNSLPPVHDRQPSGTPSPPAASSTVSSACWRGLEVIRTLNDHEFED